MFLLLALLRAAQALGWRGRTEIGGAIAPAGSGREAATGGSRATEPAAEAATAAGARTTEAARSRATEAARPGTAKTAARRTGRRRTILPGARLAHREVTALERLRVEFADHVVGLGSVGELDEREASRTAGLSIDWHDDVGWCRDRREVGSKIRFRCAVRQVPDEQTDCQGSLVKAFDSISEGQ
jgi:hypothetical protein